MKEKLKPNKLAIQEAQIKKLQDFISKARQDEKAQYERVAKKKADKKALLLKGLDKVTLRSKKSTTRQKEVEEQMIADDLLLDYIGDAEITKIFNKRLIRYP